MKLPVVCELVNAPRALIDSTKMTAFTATLRALGYDLAGCAARLGSFPSLGVNFWDQMRPQWEPDLDRPVDALISLFVDGKALAVDRLRSITSTFFVDAACEMGLLKLNVSVRPTASVNRISSVMDYCHERRDWSGRS